MSDKMRGILKALMKHHGDNQHTLAAKSGVSQPTINRFIKKVSGTFETPTVEKIASAYNITASQFRGDMPIEWLSLEEDSISINTLETASNDDQTLMQEKLIALIKSIDPRKITNEKIELIGITLEAPEDKIPILTNVTYSLSHPEQKYNAKKTRKKKQNGE